MRIALVAPLTVRVPPVAYGGTERVVSFLAEELVRRGHEVTLFACAGSITRARLFEVAPAPLWQVEKADVVGYSVLEVEEVVERAQEFDVIHSHVEGLLWPVAEHLRLPVVTTLHGRLDGPLTRRLLARFRRQPLVSVSNAQRRPVLDLDLNWTATVYHGLPAASFPAIGRGDGGYLLFVGRVSPEKGPERAIRAAIRAGMPLKIAARVGPEDQGYFEQAVAPLLSHPLIEWLGEIKDDEKLRLLRDAVALLLPIQWDEPFGLVFIEALACGTPVVGSPRGSLPELVRPGVHGLLVEGEAALAEACCAAAGLDRAACRRLAVERFSVGRMADSYETVYRAVAASARARQRQPAGV